MRAFLIATAMLVFSVLAVNQAAAVGEGKRVALVIGNSAYAHAISLPNPVNDGKLMAETLRSVGFTVISGSDLDKTAMARLLDQFTEAAYDADIAVVYYAGHGLQVDGRNYLIPVDAQLEKAAQLQTRTIPVDQMLAALPPDPAVGVIILDACRDNPLARTLAAALPVSRSSSMGAGLAAVQASGQTHSVGGLLIAYATDPGAVAYDGQMANSPYTTALARHLTTPGLEIQSALTRVRAEVSETTAGAQRPWHNASLAREVFIGGEAPVAAASPVPAPVAGATQPAASGGAANGEVDWTVEQKLWDEASKRNTVAHYELYLSQFPAGRFAGVARLNIDQLKLAATQTANLGATDAADPSLAVGASASQVRTALAIPDDVKLTPGTPTTDAQLNLDLQGRIDLQMRLRALGHDIGSFDGDIGKRSRAAIGQWQHQSGIVETTYLTSQQHMLLVVQTDPMMPQVRAEYENQKKAAASQRQTQKVSKANKQKVARTNTSNSRSQRSSDSVQYKPRNKRNSSGGSEVGAFAAGALLGTVLGVAVGRH